MPHVSSALPAPETFSAVTVAPLSFGQEQWWLMHQMEPDNAAHNVDYPIRLHGALDVAALEAALDEVRRRHEVLRTVFGLIDGVPHQLIQPFQKQKLDVVDLSHLPAAERLAEAKKLSDEDARRPFDLARGPLMRTQLLRLASDDHVWLRVNHHIVCDGWSLEILLREIGQFYEGILQGQTPELAPLPISYAEYSRQQHDLDANSQSQHLDYWLKNLSGDLSILELPTDRPRPATHTARGAHYFSRISGPAVSTLGARCREAGVTPFMALLALYAALLQKHSGQNEIMIGAALANRTRPDRRGLVGFVASTLPLRLSLDGDPSFRELTARARAVLMGAFSHAEVPFVRLIEKIAPRRDPARTPLVQTFLVALPPINSHALHGLTHEAWHVDSGAALYDVLLEVTPREDGFELQWEYNTDLFEAATIEKMAARFEHLLEAAAREFDAPLSQLEILPDAERAAISQRSKSEVVSYEYSTLHELVGAAAARTPNTVALEDEYGAALFTYDELSTQAARLARALIKQGVTRGERVAIWATRSADVLGALPAISQTGAACVPLDPHLPNARLQQILLDAAPCVLLAARAEAENFSALDLDATRVLFFEDCDEQSFQTINSAAPSTRVGENSATEAIVYLLYTSGSSGAPKGVALRQSALANLAQWQIMQSREYSGAAARTLHFAPLAFDVAWQEIAATWGAGGTLILAQDATRRDPRALLKLLAARRIERLFLPFVALQQLAESAAKIDDADFPHQLKEVVSAGEELLLTPAVAQFFERLQKYSPATLHNHYGPAETHVVTNFVLAGAARDWPPRPPIGKPIANARVWVLDKKRRLAPDGVPGEIAIGVANSLGGYWNNSQASAEKFIEIKNENQTERVYLTGDAARWNACGELEFLGRGDEQIKVRGFRVEAGEIETVLMEHPAIGGAAVLAENANQENDSSHTRLIAFIVSDDFSSGQLSAGELRRWLLARLPEYMVPANFVALGELPRTANGKVARLELLALVSNSEKGARPGDKYIAPRAGEETQLAAIWQKVLGVERVGARDNFFELGGHSLMATQVVTLLRERHGIELSLRAIFDAPTIEQLAPLLKTSAAAEFEWDEGAL